MLQQTQVKTVIPYWERWMRELPTVRFLAAADSDRVLSLWEGLGYYSRARNLQKSAREIVARHRGVFPSDFYQILDLPGIGRYTAGAIASIAFGQPAPIVDGNVARVLCRWLGLRGDPKTNPTRDLLWENAAALVKASTDPSALNQGLMELGATICLPRVPLCGQCPVASGCYARKNALVEELPFVAKPTASTARLFRAALIRKNGDILLRRRPAGVVNAGFWEMPNLEAMGEAQSKTFQALCGGPVSKLKKVCVVKHTITRYRLTLEVYEIEAALSLPAGNWHPANSLDQIPLVNSHRKALQKIKCGDSLRMKQAKT